MEQELERAARLLKVIAQSTPNPQKKTLLKGFSEKINVNSNIEETMTMLKNDFEVLGYSEYTYDIELEFKNRVSDSHFLISYILIMINAND
jgi:hypothetical protein